jgi:deoxyribonuclease IV
MTKANELFTNELLIGAHTSAAGGAYNALLEGKRIGATTVQLFTANQKRWNSSPIDQKAVEHWEQALKETGLQQIMSHDSYLINLGSPDEEGLLKSRKAFLQEVERCIQLGITYLNFHPGAALKEDPQQCLDRIVESLLETQPFLEKSSTRLLLETTAGQGSSVGHRFEQLAYIIGKVKDRIPIGVCIDTCHIFVAGYDLRTPEACDQTFKEFDKIIGLEYLYAFHLNDSVKDLGSRVDRHQPLGQGKIGLECFKYLMKDSRLRCIPKYLETPKTELWEEEIRMLRAFATTEQENHNAHKN